MSKPIAALLLLGLMIGGIALYMVRDREVRSVGVIATTTVPELGEKHITATTSAYTVDVRYPQFSISAVDTQIASMVNGVVAEFESDAEKAEGAYGQYALQGVYSGGYISPTIVSARLVISEDTGGAHPIAAAYGLNFDPTTGRALTLDDALALTGRTLQEIADEATKATKAQFGDAVFTEGLAPTKDNYSTFTIDAQKVTFIFQQYQVAAYAAGMPEVSFPRK